MERFEQIEIYIASYLEPKDYWFSIRLSYHRSGTLVEGMKCLLW
jgi:hypothetical protein